MQEWWVATVLPRALRFKRPLHRCNACNPDARRKDRGRKAELNHRSQATPGPSRHRYSCRVNRTGIRGFAPFLPVWKALAGCHLGVSFNTYSRPNGVPCGSRTRLHGFADHCLSCSANGTIMKARTEVFASARVVFGPFSRYDRTKSGMPSGAIRVREPGEPTDKRRTGNYTLYH